MATAPAGMAAKDVAMQILTFRTASGTSEHFSTARFCSQIQLNTGPTMSTAICPVPLKDFGPGKYDRQMHEIALKQSGPLGRSLKLRGRAAAAVYDPQTRVAVDLLYGWLVEHTHNLSEDWGMTQIWDDRYQMAMITVGGCLVYDPQIELYYWDFGREAVYNALGYPDCIDGPGIGPVHAPCHRCGYKDGPDGADYEEPEYGKAGTRARTWLVRDVIENLRIRHGAGGGNIGTNVDIPGRYLSPYVVWPKGLGGNLPGSDQPLKSIRLQNMSLLMALQAVIRKAGAYDIGLEPFAEFRNILKIHDMAANYPTVTLKTADHGTGFTPEQVVKSALVASEGHINKTIKNSADVYSLIGDPPAIEVTLSMLADEPRCLPGVGLEYAFLQPGETYNFDTGATTSQYYGAFKTFVEGQGNNDAALAEGFKAFPLMAAAVRVPLGINVWAGTKHAKNKNTGRMRFRPFNLTGYNQNESNPRDWIPRQIIFEFYNDYQKQTAPEPDPALDPPHEWLLCIPYDNLALSPDSTIAMVSNLRDSKQTYYIVSGNDGYPGEEVPGPDPKHKNKIMDYFRLKPLRANVTVEADWPLMATGQGDPNDAGGEIDQTGMDMAYVVYAQSGDFVELLRSPYANPEGIVRQGSTEQVRTYPAKASDGNELFSDQRLMTAAAGVGQKDIRRVECNGSLRIPVINGALKPGECVELLARDGMPCVGVMQTVTHSQTGHSDVNPDDHAPDTWLSLGPGEWHDILPYASIVPPQRKPGKDYQKPTKETTSSTTSPQNKDGYEGDGPFIGPRKDGAVKDAAARKQSVKKVGSETGPRPRVVVPYRGDSLTGRPNSGSMSWPDGDGRGRGPSGPTSTIPGFGEASSGTINGQKKPKGSGIPNSGTMNGKDRL